VETVILNLVSAVFMGPGQALHAFRDDNRIDSVLSIGSLAAA